MGLLVNIDGYKFIQHGDLLTTLTNKTNNANYTNNTNYTNCTNNAN